MSSKPPGDTTLDEMMLLLQGEEEFSIDLGSGGDLDDGKELGWLGLHLVLTLMISSTEKFNRAFKSFFYK